jgi:hypothetical protein
MTKTVSNTLVTTGVGKVNVEDVQLYPNPVNNELVIKANINQFNNVTIINAMGQTLLQQPLQSNETHIGTKSLVPGMYYIMLKGDSGVKVEKIEKL